MLEIIYCCLFHFMLCILLGILLGDIWDKRKERKAIKRMNQSGLDAAEAAKRLRKIMDISAKTTSGWSKRNERTEKQTMDEFRKSDNTLINSLNDRDNYSRKKNEQKQE